MAVQTGKTSPWLTCIKPCPGAPIRLFCFPWCGGGPQGYSNWAADLAPQIEVIGVCLPGREGRSGETPATDLRKTVKALAEEIIVLYCEKPYAFFGHSMGSVLCFEVAAYLTERYHKQPIHVFLSSEYAPHSLGRKRRLESTFHKIAEWSDDDLIKRIGSLGGTRQDLLEDKDYMKNNVLPAYRADLKLCASYVRPLVRKRPLSCDISVLQGDQDQSYDMKEYGDWTSGTIHEKAFPGGHFYLSDEAVLRSLQEYILAVLKKNYERFFSTYSQKSY